MRSLWPRGEGLRFNRIDPHNQPPEGSLDLLAVCRAQRNRALMRRVQLEYQPPYSRIALLAIVKLTNMFTHLPDMSWMAIENSPESISPFERSAVIVNLIENHFELPSQITSSILLQDIYSSTQEERDLFASVVLSSLDLAAEDQRLQKYLDSRFPGEVATITSHPDTDPYEPIVNHLIHVHAVRDSVLGSWEDCTVSHSDEPEISAEQLHDKYQELLLMLDPVSIPSCTRIHVAKLRFGIR